MTLRKDWIQSLAGKKLTLRELAVESIGPIEEIAHALAGEFRFTRQTRQRYTVAEHCVRGSWLLPPAFAGAFLLHELSEVYLPDIAGPLKPDLLVSMPDGSTVSWTDLERQHTHTILTALSLDSIEPLIYSPEVKLIDLAMLAAEKEQLCAPEPESWHLTVPAAKVDLSHVWDTEKACDQFLMRFRELFGRPSDAP